MRVYLFFILFGLLGLGAPSASAQELSSAKLDSILLLRQDTLSKLLGSGRNTTAAQQLKVNNLKALPGAPVVVFADTLFYFYTAIGPESPSARAKRVSKVLTQSLMGTGYEPSSVKAFEDASGTYVTYGQELLFRVAPADTLWSGTSMLVLADAYVQAIKNLERMPLAGDGWWMTAKRILLLLLVIVVFVIGIRFMNKAFTRLNDWLMERAKSWFINEKRLSKLKVISVDQVVVIVRRTMRLIKWVIILIIVYAVLPILFSIFPATEFIANTLLEFALRPLRSFFASFIDFIPSLITIIVIVVLTRYLVSFLRVIAMQVEHGRMSIGGFYPEWAAPTFNIAKILIYIFAFILIFPSIPGSSSPAFQGVTVFLGILISLGSSSAISNVIAGLVIIYMRAFKVGDRVKIGETTGEVTEKNMLITRVRTIKNEDITIPNAAVMTGSTINYSTNAASAGLILNTTVTIGYDVPWRKVYQLLIDAAKKTEHIKPNPEPFVLQTSLDDFYVSYQINAYTAEVKKSAIIYSELHSNIQDAFNEAGVEIMSPHYRAERDGNNTTIPPKQT